MGNLTNPYNHLGHEYILMDSRKSPPMYKGRYFILGFITGLIIAFVTGIACQVLRSPSNTVLVSSGSTTEQWPAPPPHEDVAKMARYVVHISDWASVSTISTAHSIKGYPFNNIFSISDGPVTIASGTPYLYISPLDLSAKDMVKDRRVTMSVSEAQSDYCHQQHLDPMDPRCARVLLTGTIEKVENGTKELEFARNALFSRHPDMETWPTDHDWYFGKLHIIHIYVLDYFGGASEVDVNDYYNATL